MWMESTDNKLKAHKIYANAADLDPKALSQFYDAMKLDCVVQGALMPDAHLGYALPIGAVVATKNYIFPSWVGYDIGCGMCAVKTNLTTRDIYDIREDIYDEIYRQIPVGFNIRSESATYNGMRLNDPSDVIWEMGKKFQGSLLVKDHVSADLERIWKEKNAGRALGTLGGGNHFIEIGSDPQGAVWIIIHSGSRGFGHGLATHYMKLVAGGKAKEGNYAFHIFSDEGINYGMDLAFALDWALLNRKIMMETVKNIIGARTGKVITELNFINRNHNHAEYNEDLGAMIHRKGATHAEEGMWGVIPGNMRDGCYIVIGKGNPDSLFSSSHGAGRKMGRRAAKEALKLEDFKREMEEADIVARVNNSTLDESQGAYKDFTTVMEDQTDLVSVHTWVRPLINVKG